MAKRHLPMRLRSFSRRSKKHQWTEQGTNTV